MKIIAGDENFIKKIKKDFLKEKKIIFQPLFYSKAGKNKAFEFALNFKNLPKREIPKIEDLKNIDFVWINQENDFLTLLKNKKNIFYSFSDFTSLRKELKNIFALVEGKKGFSKRVFWVVEAEGFDQGQIFKKITFLKKELLKFISKDDLKKINILVQNNFSIKENEELLRDKIINISGIIISEHEEE